MSLTVTGFFALANGRHDSVTSTANKVTTYITYDSSFTCIDGTSSPILIRHFSAQHAVLTDNTIIFLFAKAGFPSAVHEPIVFQALHFYAIPGDATSPDYENSAPDMLHPIACAVGHVTSSLSPATDCPRKFTITTSSYVTTGNVTSSIICVLENARRWAKPPPVSMTSCVAVTGSFQSIAADNQLSIAVDDVALNLSSKTVASTPGASSSSPKRKFNAYTARKTTTASPSMSPLTSMQQQHSSEVQSSQNSSSYVLGASDDADAEESRGKKKRSKQ